MPAEGWKLVSLVSVVQVLSEAVYFAQGILASEEINIESSGRKELDWIRICVPLFYAATRQISEPCWRWILRGYGDRMTTALGAAVITISIVATSCEGVFLGEATYIFMGGIGMGLVRLQLKFMKSQSEEAKWPLWGAGNSGIGLSLWPLLACLFVRSLGPRYATLVFAGITLHAVPLALLTQPAVEDRSLNPEDGEAIRSAPASTEIPSRSKLQEYRTQFQLINEYDSYRIRPSYYVEVLPGIPEEVEHESDHERDHEMQRTVSETTESVAIYEGEKGGRKSSLQKEKRRKKLERKATQKRKTEIVTFEERVIKTKPFGYAIFVATILLRVGDQLGVTIVISFLPIFAGYLMPDLRIQEKAFLVSLCGFSKILSEFPLLGLHMRSKKTKLVILAGPLSAAAGLYLTWNSANLDSMTLASFGLGIGSGAASAALQFMVPEESPGVSDTADIIVGFSLLAIVPLMRILILEHAIEGSLLLAAGMYTAAAITSVFSLRRNA